MKISRITIGRLYNLGNYEHVRYEITVDIGEIESAANVMTGLERILEGLKPLKLMCLPSAGELKRQADEVEKMRTMPVVEWQQRYGHCKGTPSEVIDRYQKDLEDATVKTTRAIEKARKARELFDDLGGAAQWKDAKLDWDDYPESYDD